jgi:protein required for attachment to host cells
MNPQTRICFLIADGEHARLVTSDANHVLRTSLSFDSATAHKASHDLGSDSPGRSFESGGPTRHAMATKHDPHQLEKMKFARFVAAEAGKAASEGQFDHLVLAAPAHVLREIEAALDTRTEAMVAGKLLKDLVKVPDHELWPHLHEWVSSPRRAPTAL